MHLQIPDASVDLVVAARLARNAYTDLRRRRANTEEQNGRGSEEEGGLGGAESGAPTRVAPAAEDQRGRARMAPSTPSAQPAAEVLARLTPRQREVMALAASGYDAVGIAERLHLAHVSIRRELSLAYRVLVPNPQPGTDLRTAAVLEYLRLMPTAGEPAAEE